jgi:hypothetical protein
VRAEPSLAAMGNATAKRLSGTDSARSVQQSLRRSPREVSQEALDHEQRGAGTVVASRVEGSCQLVADEVDRHEHDLVARRTDRREPGSFVSLGGGMVDFEPSHPRRGEAQRATVVPGSDDDDLAHAAVQSSKGHAVEERGAARHSLPPLAGSSPERASTEGQVEASFSPGVPRRHLGAIEFRAGERHETCRGRRLTRLHHSSP